MPPDVTNSNLIMTEDQWKKTPVGESYVAYKTAAEQGKLPSLLSGTKTTEQTTGLDSFTPSPAESLDDDDSAALTEFTKDRCDNTKPPNDINIKSLSKPNDVNFSNNILKEKNPLNEQASTRANALRITVDEYNSKKARYNLIYELKKDPKALDDKDIAKIILKQAVIAEHSGEKDFNHDDKDPEQLKQLTREIYFKITGKQLPKDWANLTPETIREVNDSILDIAGFIGAKEGNLTVDQYRALPDDDQDINGEKIPGKSFYVDSVLYSLNEYNVIDLNGNTALERQASNFQARNKFLTTLKNDAVKLKFDPNNLKEAQVLQILESIPKDKMTEQQKREYYELLANKKASPATFGNNKYDMSTRVRQSMEDKLLNDERYAKTVKDLNEILNNPKADGAKKRDANRQFVDIYSKYIEEKTAGMSDDQVENFINSEMNGVSTIEKGYIRQAIVINNAKIGARIAYKDGTFVLTRKHMVQDGRDVKEFDNQINIYNIQMNEKINNGLGTPEDIEITERYTEDVSKASKTDDSFNDLAVSALNVGAQSKLSDIVEHTQYSSTLANNKVAKEHYNFAINEGSDYAKKYYAGKVDTYNKDIQLDLHQMVVDTGNVDLINIAVNNIHNYDQSVQSAAYQSVINAAASGNQGALAAININQIPVAENSVLAQKIAEAQQTYTQEVATLVADDPATKLAAIIDDPVRNSTTEGQKAAYQTAYDNFMNAKPQDKIAMFKKMQGVDKAKALEYLIKFCPQLFKALITSLGGNLADFLNMQMDGTVRKYILTYLKNDNNATNKRAFAEYVLAHKDNYSDMVDDAGYVLDELPKNVQDVIESKNPSALANNTKSGGGNTNYATNTLEMDKILKRYDNAPRILGIG